MAEPKPPFQIRTPDTNMEKLNIKVLVADDEKGVRELTVTVLERMGCTVEEVDDGQALLDRLATAKPGEFGLLFTDKQMPVKSGIDVIKEVRSNERFRHLPLILYSGDSENEVETRKIVEDAGGIYLAKPVSVAKMRDAVRKALTNTTQ